MQSWLRCTVLALFSIGAAIQTAHAQQTLPTVEVTATTSDGGSISIPYFAKTTSQLSPYLHLGNDGATIDMTLQEYCAQLGPMKPSGCSLTTYPAAPGIISASGASWSGNGCGASPWSTAFASGALSSMYGSMYSGDINRPVAGNPSIDFTVTCNKHDKDYTSLVYKVGADSNFALGLQSLCGGSTNPTMCQSFANAYVKAVSDYGAGAYQADQAQLQCAAWGDSMKKSGCHG